MNRRQAMAAVGTLAFAGGGVAQVPARTLKVSIVIPDLLSLDGVASMPRTLWAAGYSQPFHVAVENVSSVDVTLWTEGNSEGYGTLSFEVIDATGATTVVKKASRQWRKNIIQGERLIPGGLQIRAIRYAAEPGRESEWEKFPFNGKDPGKEVTLRAVFEQKEADWSEKLKPWVGKVASAPVKVLLRTQ